MITFSAVMVALSVVFMYFASILPTGSFAFAAAASLAGIAVIIEFRLAAGLFVYIGTSVLGTLIVPNKSVMLLYVLFFGYYPIIKSIAERFPKRIPEWLLKIAVFNAALAALLLLFSSVVYDAVPWDLSLPMLVLLLNGVFILFDIGVSKLIGYYISRISSKIKH